MEIKKTGFTLIEMIVSVLFWVVAIAFVVFMPEDNQWP